MVSNNDSESGGTASPTGIETRIKKPSLTKTLPSDRLTLDRQIDALRAFGAVSESNGGKPVTNQQAGDVAKMAAATIVVTNAWFVDVGLLTRAEDGFLVAPEVSAFLTAEHGIAPESAPEKLRPIFERHWAAQILVPRLKVSSMGIETARKVLGEACTAAMDHLGRLDLLIDFLVYVGVVRKEGNQLRLNAGGTKQETPVVKPPDSQGNGNGNGNHGLNEEGLETYTLTLDPQKNRRVIIKAPPTVTDAELKRIQAWLSFQLIVEGKQD